jgi:hypothetical protein
MINRRNILKVFGAGAIGGKKVVEEAANTAITDLGLRGVTASTDEGMLPYGGADVNHKSMLRRWLDPEYLSRRRKEFHVHALDVDVHVLKSMSLCTKIRISRERQFDRHAKNQRNMLENLICGNEDY